MTRRDFLSSLGLATATLTSPLGTELAFAAVKAGASPRRATKRLVVLFQRGACDGLSLLPPIRDENYLKLRPSIAIPKAKALLIDPLFGLHPACQALVPAWEEKELLFIHGFGHHSVTRSHFDAQDYLETGTPGVKSTTDGFLSRALVSSRPRAAAKSPVRAVAIQGGLPRMLQGDANAISMRSLKDFGGNRGGQTGVLGFESIYTEAVDQVFHGISAETFSSIKSVRDRVKPAAHPFPKGEVATRLKEIAELFASDLGCEVAVSECGGWDTHAGQGGVTGTLQRRLEDLAEGLAAFRSAMIKEKLWSETLVLVVTEFGRTVKENGTGGTDHGHGSVAIALGGDMGKRSAGGRVVHQWKGLSQDALFEERDLPVDHDFRDVLGEALISQFGLSLGALGTVFPGHRFKSLKLFT